MAAKGSRLAMMHQYSAAQSAFELVLAAARAAQDRQNEGEALQNIANALYFQRELLKAREYYQQRLDLAREMHDDDATAASWLGVATTAYARGEYTPALEAYRAALGVYEKSATD